MPVPAILYMLLTFVRRNAWELVNVFTRVFRVGNAESEVEVEALEKFVSKVVAFDHPEIIDWFITHSEFYPETCRTNWFITYGRFMWFQD